jgi:hypothetical protein
MADKPDPLVPPVLVSANSDRSDLPGRLCLATTSAQRMALRDGPSAHGPVGALPWLKRAETHQNTWWMEVGCRAYEEDGDMRARGTTGGATGRRPSRASRPGHRGLVAGRGRVEIVHAMAARRAWW